MLPNESVFFENKQSSLPFLRHLVFIIIIKIYRLVYLLPTWKHLRKTTF